jgi:hypothetical protein
MKLKIILRTLILSAVVVLGLGILRYLTVYTLVFGIYGESEIGLEKAYYVYRLFPIRHFPILLPLTLLSYQTFRQKLFTENKQKLYSNLIIGLIGIITYIIIESLRILGSF